jgi:hypothetical protein
VCFVGRGSVTRTERRTRSAPCVKGQQPRCVRQRCMNIENQAASLTRTVNSVRFGGRPSSSLESHCPNSIACWREATGGCGHLTACKQRLFGRFITREAPVDRQRARQRRPDRSGAPECCAPPGRPLVVASPSISCLSHSPTTRRPIELSLSRTFSARVSSGRRATSLGSALLRPQTRRRTGAINSIGASYQDRRRRLRRPADRAIGRVRLYAGRSTPSPSLANWRGSAFRRRLPESCN